MRGTYGASHVGYRYALQMFVALEMATAMAMATARLAFGRGMVEEIQAMLICRAEQEPQAWRNMAKYLTPSVGVAIAMIWPAAAMQEAKLMW